MFLFMYRDGGSFMAYRVFMFMYSDGGSFRAYRVFIKIHRTVQVMVLINKFLICVSNF